MCHMQNVCSSSVINSHISSHFRKYIKTYSCFHQIKGNVPSHDWYALWQQRVSESRLASKMTFKNRHNQICVACVAQSCLYNGGQSILSRRKMNGKCQTEKAFTYLHCQIWVDIWVWGQKWFSSGAGRLVSAAVIYLISLSFFLQTSIYCMFLHFLGFHQSICSPSIHVLQVMKHQLPVTFL